MRRKKDYSKIQQKFDERLDHMTENKCKVTFFRMDVRFPKDYPHDGTNSDFSSLMKLLKEKRSRDDKGDFHYVWGREQNKSENPHYHLAGIVDGNKTQNARGILSDADEIWGRITASPKKGLVDFCNRENGKKVEPYFRIDRPAGNSTGEKLATEEEAFKEGRRKAAERASYIAKPKTKGKAPLRVREYGASELATDKEKKLE